jgi:uncharacterized protein
MIRRKIYADLIAHLSFKEYTVLIGARQTGKSTLLRQVADFLQHDEKQVVVLNLERREVLQDLDQHPENVFKYLPKPAVGARIFVLIDEVQYLQDPTHFIKLLYDEYATTLKLVVTGSSAFYIDQQFRDSLAGRKKIFELPTLDFEEFLLFGAKNDQLTALHQLRHEAVATSTLLPLLWVSMEEYLTYGGYPAVVLEPNLTYKIERLQELRDAFVKRDMLEAGITDETKFFRMMTVLASQSGNLLNISELSNTLRMTNATTEHFIYVLQKCFHVGLVRPFYQNLRKELVKMPKIYFGDLGMRNALVNYFAPLEQRTDKGQLLENYVYRRLTELYSRDQVKFWRTADGNEVDFVVEETAFGGRAIEVKFNPEEAKPNKYKKFVEAYPQFPLQFASWKEVGLLR